jgi:hypothetical protein
VLYHSCSHTSGLTSERTASEMLQLDESLHLHLCACEVHSFIDRYDASVARAVVSCDTLSACVSA